jgi:Cupredoxin-like domain
MRVALVLTALVLMAGTPMSPAEAADPVELSLTIENHRFTPEEVRVKAGVPFVLVLTNKDKTPEEFESKDLRLEKIIPGGKTLRLRMPALKAGTYRFVGEYNEQTAKGRLIAE